MDTAAWKKARNILCVRLDNMGDVLMTTPAFRALKEFNPDARLTLLTSHMGAGIASFIPEIDEVIEFNVPWIQLNTHVEASPAVMDLVLRLQQGEFEAAILFTVFSQNPLPAALLCYLAKIPLRLGYCRENPYGLLSHWVPDTEPFSGIQHEVIRQLRLVELIGATTTNHRLSLSVTDEMCISALEKLQQQGVDLSQHWLILHPGASEKRRCYSAAGYVDAGRELIRQGFQIIITGGESEKDLVHHIVYSIGGGAWSLAGQLSLAEFIGLVASTSLVISNNTGTVHIAAAAGTPVIVLYARTNPQHTPWQVPNRILYFEVPPEQRSKNVLLNSAYVTMFNESVSNPRPEAILDAVQGLLNNKVPPA